MTTRRIPLIAAIAALTFTAAACGDDDPNPVDAPPTTEAMTEDTMMTEDSMVDEMMTEDSMVDEMMTGTTTP